MTAIKKAILAFTALNVFSFYLCAFANWNVNPYFWGEFTRIIYCCFSLISVFIASGTYNFNRKLK